jgi:transcriptional regulator with XRE-family HTH domain
MGDRVSDDISRRRRRKYTQHRSENMALWVNEPLQNLIRDELARRDQTISDLARKIGSQPSLVSRWMQGQRPNTESLALIADALGLDVLHLLNLAGHIPPGVIGDEGVGDDARAILAMIRQADRDGRLTPERVLMLHTLVELIRTMPAVTTPHTNSHPPGLRATG